jgi:hypothetical protein
MVTLHHNCGECSSEFNIKYDELECEDAPHYCPFCGEYLVDELDIEDDES